MQPFLHLVAEHIQANYAANTEHLCIVLPNKRGALFLKKHLAKVFNKTIWLPTIISAEDLISNLSGLQQADEIDLICELYQAYCLVLKDKAEPFEAFAKWGNLMLQDFNEADRYLVDTSVLYQELKEIKVIENWSLSADSLTTTQEEYCQFMYLMGEIYQVFTQQLLQKKLAYQGLMYRKAVEQFPSHSYINQFEQFIFAGFNALNKAETIILSELVKNKKATVLWDADAYYLHNEAFEAGTFLRKHQQSNWLSSKHYVGDYFKTIIKKIDIVAVPKQIGQAQVVAHQLQQWIAEGKATQNTAIVLADESLLFPILNQLPKEIEHVNITMEYPLRYTALYDLIEHLIYLQASSQKANSQSFYFEDVFKILQNTLFNYYFESFETTTNVQQIIQRIIDKNYVWLNHHTLADLFGTSYVHIQALFTKWTDASQGVSAIAKLIERLNSVDTHSAQLSATEKEYLHVFTKYFNRLQDLITTTSFLESLQTLRSLYKQIIGTASVPFIGEPLQGLQIMGVLETRTLDFENIILLGVNEGVLPSGKSNNSFIPNDLKRHHEMPLYADKDAIYAYHFYRLLQRSSNVVLTYNTEPASIGSSEKSRFITQLLFELPLYQPQHIITERMLSGGDLPASGKNSIEIKKTAIAIQPIIQKISSGDLYFGLSPSAINTYKDCTLKFYFRYGLGIKETEEIEESAEASTLGSILHKALETMYTPLKGKVLNPDELTTYLPRIQPAVDSAFEEKFSQKESQFGKNYLQRQVLYEYVAKLINNDIALIKQSQKQNELLSIIDLEKDMTASVMINYKGQLVEAFIKGSADRIDKLGNTIRIIDYKSSIKTTDDFKFTDFETLFSDSDCNKLLQLFMYVWLAVKNNIAEPEQIQPCIIPFKKFEEKPRLILDGSTKKTTQLIFTHELLTDFENHLIRLIEEMIDEQTVFKQTDDTTICNYCSYAKMCNIISV